MFPLILFSTSGRLREKGEFARVRSRGMRLSPSSHALFAWRVIMPNSLFPSTQAKTTQLHTQTTQPFVFDQLQVHCNVLYEIFQGFTALSFVIEILYVKPEVGHYYIYTLEQACADEQGVSPDQVLRPSIGYASGFNI